MPRYILKQGDCLDVLATAKENSIDSIVCDPPYALTNRVMDVLYCESCGRVMGGKDGKPKQCPRCASILVRRRTQVGAGFMGKDWDTGDIAFHPAVWEAALRVAKPGAHLLAFGGTRTHHRLMCAIEDAGWEIRDCLMWLYASGMPKGQNISKMIDKQANVKQEIADTRQYRSAFNSSGTHQVFAGETHSRSVEFTVATSEEAKQWDGWNTHLKPAWEPIILARKPISEKTIAANVLKWGTGALNIDACRIGTVADMNPADFDDSKRKSPKFSGVLNGGKEGQYRASSGSVPNGRWPANLLLDEESAKLLNEQSGTSKSPNSYVRNVDSGNKNSYGKGMGETAGTLSLNYGDSGGVSRFFYCAKASKRDRDEGLEGMPEYNGGHYAQDEWSRQNMGNTPDVQRSKVHNNHPTVKPTSLMRYLVRLITPSNGWILDPFMGSGSTGKAALLEGFRFAGIELDKEYFEIAQRRLAEVESSL